MKKGTRLYAWTMILTLLFWTLAPAGVVFAVNSPVITISMPANNYVTAMPEVVVGGYATDATSLIINGNAVAINSDGSFTHTVRNLSTGLNTIILVASNSAGVASSQLNVNYYASSSTPQIDITSPADNFLSAIPTVVVTGTVFNNTSLKYKINGSPETDIGVLNGPFSQSFTLANGNNTIELIARKDGIAVTKTLHVRYGNNSLINSIKVNGNPYTDFFSVGVTPVSITGSVSGGIGTIVVNGSTVSVAANTFNVPAYSLNEGLNVVTLTAVDPLSGLTETKNLNIYYGPLIGPKVYNVEVPSPWNTSSYTVKGVVRNAHTVTVKNVTNGNTYTLNTSSSFSAPYTFSAGITLAPGTNSITITAQDTTGNVTNVFPTPGAPFLLAPYQVEYRTTAQILNVTPVNGTTTNSGSITVQGNAFGCLTGSLAINGQAVPFDVYTGAFSKEITLKSGYNAIDITYKDLNGVSRNHPTFYVNFVSGPSIENVLPTNGTIIFTNSVTVTGTVANAAGTSVTMYLNDDTQGVAVGYGANGIFSKTFTNLRQGNNTVKISVSDGVSTVTKTVSFRYDSSPSIIITSPQNEAAVVKDVVTITGKVSNFENSRISINQDNVWVNSDGSFSKTVNLKNIVNNFTISAVSGDKVNTINHVVYYSGVPGITVTSHSNGDTVQTADVVFEGRLFPANKNEIRTFTINGVDNWGKITDNGFVSYPVTLRDGDNDIEFKLTTVGSLGNGLPSRDISFKIKITYNNGPEIIVSSPIDGATSYDNMVTVYGTLKKADSNTLKVGGKDTRISPDGSFAQTVELKSGKNDIKLEAKSGDKTTTKTIQVNYDAVARTGSVVKFKMDDGGEANAFDNLAKIKLTKGSVGLNTSALISLRSPSDVHYPPEQSAYIGPVVNINWSGTAPLKPYKVTLKYDEVVGENQAHKISVLYYDDDVDKWKVLGGVVDAKTRTISVMTDKEGYFAAVMYFKTFSDVLNHWARRDIEMMVAKGAISASEDYFRPNDKITRGDFVTYLVKALGIQPYDPVNGPSYDDVSEDDSNFEYIEAALRAGLVTGVSSRKFAPNQYITREEAGVILTRAGNLKTVKDQETIKIFSKFSDAQYISFWARKELASAIKAKVLNGSDDGTFKPKANTTKAEAVSMMARLAEIVAK